jgi:hypothetical protein
MPDNNVYALFIDVMGFADALTRLTRRELPLVTKILTNDLELGRDLPPAVVNVVGNYRFFHDTLSSSISYGDDVRAVITFSDSAFVIAKTFDKVESIAWLVMRACFTHHVPLRMGIGRGTFARLSFSTSTHPSNLLAAHAPFLGTSVIYAHRAESSRSALGFRILVHPSARRRLPETNSFTVDLPGEERSVDCVQEINFVSLSNVTDTEVLRKRPDEPHVLHLTHMRRQVKNDRALRHFDASEVALMRLSGEWAKYLERRKEEDA